jgi:hypothetical protein
MTPFESPPTALVLHCSAGPDRILADWPAVIRYHVDTRGWEDVGYHYGLEFVQGDIVLQAGRPAWAKGSHCRAGGMNHRSIGLCVVGEFEHGPLLPALYWATVDAIAWLCRVHDIAPVEVYGHREFESGKTCPGRAWSMETVRCDLVARTIAPRPMLVRAAP